MGFGGGEMTATPQSGAGTCPPEVPYTHLQQVGFRGLEL